MKRTIFTLVAGISLMLGANVVAQTPCCGTSSPTAFSGVGPVVAGSVDTSQLPKSAHDFLKKHFKEYAVTQCEKEFDDNTYEVELSNGIDIEFNNRGEWNEVEAGRSRVLTQHLVRSLIPDKAFRELVSRKVAAQIESVKRYNGGYKVEIKNAKYDDYRFAHDGKLLGISD